MLLRTEVSVRPAEPKDRSQLASLIHFETHVHRHLDWRPPLDWLGHEPYLVAERAGRIIATLACPPDPPDVAWIRTFAVSSRISPLDAWQMLWPQAEERLPEQPAVKVAAIPLQKWFRLLLEENNFERRHYVVVLAWDNNRTELPEPQTGVSIRGMTSKDLDAVQEIDSAAFGSLWRNSLDSLRLAFQQAAVATVAESDDGLAGYQISTPSPVGAHLARLAVHPKSQRQGVGFALVRDLQRQFLDPEPQRISVNTQSDNLASLALYEKAGFRITGEEYPIYQYNGSH